MDEKSVPKPGYNDVLIKVRPLEQTLLSKWVLVDVQVLYYRPECRPPTLLNGRIPPRATHT